MGVYIHKDPCHTYIYIMRLYSSLTRTVIEAAKLPPAESPTNITLLAEEPVEKKIECD